MDQFIYWGVFAAFGLIVVAYTFWMLLANRRVSREARGSGVTGASGPELRLHGPGGRQHLSHGEASESDTSGGAAAPDEPARTFQKRK